MTTETHSDTPRTDAAAADYGRGRSMGCVSEEFARTLEHENAALREVATKLTEALDGGLEPELSGMRLLRSQLRNLLKGNPSTSDCGGLDAARWQWWRKHWCDPDSDAIGHHDIGDCADAESLDAAIDAQIAAEGPARVTERPTTKGAGDKCPDGADCCWPWECAREACCQRADQKPQPRGGGSIASSNWKHATGGDK